MAALSLLSVTVVALPGQAHAVPDGVADVAVSVTADVAQVDLSVSNTVTYTVSVTNTDPVLDGTTAIDVTLTDIVLDKPGAALPLGSPLNLTPLQGAAIDDGAVTVTTGQGTCSMAPFHTTSTPLQVREYGERLVCDLDDLAPQETVVVTIPVIVDLNTFVVLQPAGAIVDLATVELCPPPAVALCTPVSDDNRDNNSAQVHTTVVRPVV